MSDFFEIRKDSFGIRMDSYYKWNRLQDILNTPIKTPKTLDEELALSYEEYVVYLLNKYGKAECDYFANRACRIENSAIERLDEGLFCHHIAEECGMALDEITEYDYAISKPFELYQAQNFVYGNYLEHLLLHIKITQEDIRVESDESIGINTASVKMICRELNRFYATGKCPIVNKKAAELVKDRYEDYLSILTWVLQDKELSKFYNIEDFVLDVNGLRVQKIAHDLYERTEEV